MCLILDINYHGTKTKSRDSSKMPKKQKCHECNTRKIAREEVKHIMNQDQPVANYNYGYGYRYGYGYDYRYGDWLAWQDNRPMMVSEKRWREYAQSGQDVYNTAQENGRKINEVKSAITGEIREVREAIKEAQAGVSSTESYVKETRDAIDLAHAGIRGTHIAVKEAQLAIQETQEACAADIASVRQMLGEEAKKRENAARQRLEAEKERRYRAEGEAELLRRGQLYSPHPRFQGAYDDHLIEASPYGRYAYAEYGVGRGARGGQLPRHAQLGCANMNARLRDY
ncbi:hypothetical protein SAMD00023353_0302910 [Rosellinia necatrix]|uniref:Uncharacterized protein n=1 Tax=Rosellinia necatrix TaxID=77044 RepID=A0A1W2TDT2_ROSNE|nr:hypothetical protein SAMD00023353_0302910 [Rosellinia necatrix]